MAFYFRTMEKMANFWMFIPHLFRGFVGLRIYFRMPRSHELVKSLGFDADAESNQNLSFEEVQRRVKYEMERIFFDFVKEMKLFFKIYFFATVFCGILDFINFIIIYYHFGEPGEEYQEMMLMLLALVYFSTNLLWVGFVCMLRRRFPPYMVEYAVQMFFSAGARLEEKVMVWNEIAKAKMQATSEAAMRRLSRGRNDEHEGGQEAGNPASV